LAFRFCTSSQNFSNDSVCYDYDTLRRASQRSAASSTRIDDSTANNMQQPVINLSSSEYSTEEETLQLTSGKRKQRAKINLKNRFSLNRSSYYLSHREVLYENTQLEMDQSSFDISKFPLLVTTPDKSKALKLTSTAIGCETSDSLSSSDNSVEKWPSVSNIYKLCSGVISEEGTFNEYEESEHEEEGEQSSSSNAFSNYLYNSPVLTRKKSLSNSTTPSSCFTNSSASSSTSDCLPNDTNCEAERSGSFSDKYVDSFGFHTKDFQTAASHLFDSDAEKASSVSKKPSRGECVTSREAKVSDQYLQTHIYICCISYEARSPTELSIEFTDRLKLVQQLDDWDYCLVQNVVSKKYGYVPKHCVSELNTFLNDVKYLRKKA
jgi:hypothetical protein